MAACSSLVSTSNQPPGASHAGASATTPPGDVEPVRAAVEGHPRLVLARLGRHQRDRVARHVRRVGDQQVDPAAQGRRQRREQVALVHPAADRARFRRAHGTAAGSTSAACSSTSSTAVARAAPIAPEPQQRSTTHAPGRARATASSTRSSLRCRGTKTPAPTAIRSP